MRAVGNNVIIEPILPEKKGIFFLPDHLQSVAGSQYGTVLSVGKDVQTIKVGDIALYRRFICSDGSIDKVFVYDNKFLLRVRESSLMGFMR